MSSKKYGLIGCGMMGQEHIRNVALLEGAAFSMVYDPVRDLADAAVRLSGTALIADSLDDLIADESLDAVVIASPNHVHVDQMRAIAERRTLPILVEKPLYTDLAQADALTVLGRNYGAPIWVAMEYRYMEPIAALVERAEQVTGGVRMLTIREHRFPFLPKVGNWNRFNSQTGGTLVEKCCHFFDLMRLVLKSEPVRVMASGGQDVNHLSEVVDGKTPDVWDNAYVIVDFASGARAMLELCMFAEGSRYQEEIMAVGGNGKIEAQVPGPERFWPRALGPQPVPRVITSPRTPMGPVIEEMPVAPEILAAGDHNGSTFYQHQHFLEVVRGNGAPEVTLDDGAKAVQMGLAAQRSATESIVVTL
ncbi:Gfo/Idh/MocA family protein [Aestuariibius sp. 2305UL40-4]|uniref:Gfo/Idh/MocA family protein n=1 Tax=Aestuariibius violaceus TaxID=3234132 RepID=UPI00345E288F